MYMHACNTSLHVCIIQVFMCVLYWCLYVYWNSIHCVLYMCWESTHDATYPIKNCLPFTFFSLIFHFSLFLPLHHIPFLTGLVCRTIWFVIPFSCLLRSPILWKRMRVSSRILLNAVLLTLIHWVSCRVGMYTKRAMANIPGSKPDSIVERISFRFHEWNSEKIRILTFQKCFGNSCTHWYVILFLTISWEDRLHVVVQRSRDGYGGKDTDNRRQGQHESHHHSSKVHSWHSI